MTNSDDQIYVIEHQHGYVKIGKSNNPCKRISSIRTACPYDVELLTTIDVIGDWRVIETALHEAYADEKRSGEWFELSAHQKVHLTEIDEIDSRLVEYLGGFKPSSYVEMTEEKKRRWLLSGDYEVKI